MDGTIKKRRHGGAKRAGLTYDALRRMGYTSATAAADGLLEPREDYLARAEERGRRVLELRAEGKTIRAIAEELDVSVGTVHRHIKAARRG